MYKWNNKLIKCEYHPEILTLLKNLTKKFVFIRKSFVNSIDLFTLVNNNG